MVNYTLLIPCATTRSPNRVLMMVVLHSQCLMHSGMMDVFEVEIERKE